VAIDLVLMRSDPLDIAAAFPIGRGTLHKLRQDLAWAVTYNAVALPVAVDVFDPDSGSCCDRRSPHSP